MFDPMHELIGCRCSYLSCILDAWMLLQFINFFIRCTSTLCYVCDDHCAWALRSFWIMHVYSSIYFFYSPNISKSTSLSGAAFMKIRLTNDHMLNVWIFKFHTRAIFNRFSVHLIYDRMMHTHPCIHKIKQPDHIQQTNIILNSNIHTQKKELKEVKKKKIDIITWIFNHNHQESGDGA